MPPFIVAALAKVLTGLAPRVLAALALVAGVLALGWYIDGQGYNRAQAEHAVALAELHAQAANTLTLETQKTRAAEQALGAAKNKQEIKDAKNTQIVAAMSSRLYGLAGSTAGLRDPRAVQCGGSSSGPPAATAPATGAGAAHAAEAGGVLSKELSGLLLKLTREADDINAAFSSCKSDALAVRAGQLP